ncbi:MAG TPA: asparagine synthase (glutamine-hydrolyzing) [Saprospiraceae bacterium]|nr:asparagine synthase (glutamine-hydrolyzing) [Saprospiraceae bacterium]
MCGLAGIYNLDGAPVDCQVLLRMTRLIRHRGPDDEGFLLVHTATGLAESHVHEDTIPEIRLKSSVLPVQSSANLGMGFRRLSIIDTSAKGHQPMCDDQGRCWLSFNGEIYNYLEIRSELIALGHQFHSGSDSEVLLQAYRQWGVECLQRFIGMFAFVLYDLDAKQLFAARDRMGVKPFLYHFNGRQLVWASEEKQIVKSKAVAVTVNEQRMLEFLRDVRYFETPDSFYQEILQLPAGHYLIADASGISIRSYWDIPIPDKNLLWNEEKSIEAVRHLLEDSIRLRLRSDVPLGIALSGGIDSSSVCCLARGLTETDIQTFSVYYEGKAFDERPYVEAVLKTGGFKPHYFTGEQHVDPDQIARWIYQQDAPTTGASPYSAYQNYRNVCNAGIIVLLNGQGGDELFAGYPYFNKYHLAGLLRDFSPLEYLRTASGIAKNQGISKAAGDVFFSSALLVQNADRIRQLEYRKYSCDELYPERPRESSDQAPPQALSMALYDSIRRTHLPHMLRWEDRNSMAHSIESRVPFLDHRLVEQSFYIPDGLKLHRGTNKYILRKSMKNKVPDVILKRKDKVGFATPTDLWTQTILKENIRELLHAPDFNHRPWLHGDKIRQRFEKQPQSFGVHELWRIYSSELWMRHAL